MPKTLTLRRIARSLLLVAALAQVGRAGDSFGAQQIVTTQADAASSVFAVDLDGDGDLDVLSASGSDDKLAWYENTDGQGAFGSQQIITSAADDARTVFAADLDGDGDPDVLSASFGDSKIAWYENTDGLGTFGAQQVISTSASFARSVFAADLDGDGDLDVLSASFGDDKLAWYANTNGLGAFGPQQIISTAADGAWSVYAADVDGDGDQDVLSASVIDDEIAWYENTNGLGTFGPQQLVTTLADSARSVFAADVDGDGDQDVLSASLLDDEIAWYENTDGLGGFGAQQVVTNSADGAQAVFAADLDGDGDQDLLSASAAEIAWYENTDGLGSFGPQLVITHAAPSGASVFAADLDGDGDLDVLSASLVDDLIAWYENGPPPLTASLGALSLAAGGTQTLTLCAGGANAFGLYFLLTTTTGTSPGSTLPPTPFVLPLNFSNLLLFTALNPNLLIPNSLDFLDASGQRTLALTLPPGLDPGLAGVTLHSAYLLLDFVTLNATFVSNAVGLTLMP